MIGEIPLSECRNEFNYNFPLQENGIFFVEYSEIVRYKATVQLTPIPNACKLSDIYATLTPILVPSTQLAIRWVFINRAYAGLLGYDHLKLSLPW